MSRICIDHPIHTMTRLEYQTSLNVLHAERFNLYKKKTPHQACAVKHGLHDFCGQRRSPKLTRRMGRVDPDRTGA